MEITNEVKQRIVAAIAADRENYPSDNDVRTNLKQHSNGNNK